MNRLLPSSAVLPLCDDRGRLNPDAIGWSGQPKVDCAIPGHRGRRKRWNHWSVATPGWVLTLTLADFDYLTYGGVCFLDLDNGESVCHTQTRLFGNACRLPGQPKQSHAFEHPRLLIRADVQDGRTCLSTSVPDLGGQPLQAAFDIQQPLHLQSSNLVAPVAGGGFHAASHQLGLPVRGSLRLGRREYGVCAGQSFAALDFGRGVWPLRSQWRHAAFAAPGIAGHFGNGDGEPGLLDNTLWFGGQPLHLPRPVRIDTTASALEPWRLQDSDGGVELAFTPRRLHHIRPRFGPLHVDTRQWFGRYDGMLRGPGGERVPVRNALGWIDETRTRW